MNSRRSPHQGGGGAFHGDAAGGSQVGHGDIVLHRDLSLLGQPCLLYTSVTKLTNSIRLDGKKGVAQKVVYGAFDIIKAVSYTHLAARRLTSPPLPPFSTV